MNKTVLMGGPGTHPTGSRANALTELCVLNAHLRESCDDFGFRRDAVRCLTRDDRPVRFAPPDSIPILLERSLEIWERRLVEARDALGIAEACARFWISFVAIHPFPDKNGRTGQEFLRRGLARRGIRVTTFQWVDRYLIEGSFEQDMSDLTRLFLLTLDLRSPGLERGTT